VLRPFSIEQSRQFVSAALGGAQVPPEVAALLWERSNGLPSFLEQLVVFLQLFVQTQLQTAAAAAAAAAAPGGAEDGSVRRVRLTTRGTANAAV
jgi:predicted ATPase